MVSRLTIVAVAKLPLIHRFNDRILERWVFHHERENSDLLFLNSAKITILKSDYVSTWILMAILLSLSYPGS
jgi:hypothetical protein